MHITVTFVCLFVVVFALLAEGFFLFSFVSYILNFFLFHFGAVIVSF